MKKAIAIIISILFVFAFTSVSFAIHESAEKPETPVPVEKKAVRVKAEKKAPAKVKHVIGEVTAVDAKAKTITVKGKKGDVVIAVDDKMMTDVKAGDKVTVKYTEADGKNTAKSVKKAAAKKEKKAEKKAEPAKMEKKAEPTAKPAEKK